MIFLFLIFTLSPNSYLDSLFLSNLYKNFESETLKNFDTLEVKFIYRKGNLVRIEKNVIKEDNEIENKIFDITKNNLSSNLEQSTLRRGTGLIPEITIPVPVELPFGLTEETKIKISGFQDLSMGIQRYDFSAQSSTTPQGSSSPGIVLEQHLKVNTEGIIGGKIHILLDHDSQRESQDLNTIKIRYEGDEDEIIKYLEGGNKIGQTGGGFFGLAGKFQLGPLDLEGIVSREMGNKKEITLSKGGVIIDTIKIEDKDYEKNKFFYLPLSPGDKIDSIYLFYNDNIESNDTNIINPYKGRIFLYEKPDSLSDKIYTFQLLKLDSTFSFAFFSNVIQLKLSNLSQDFILAVVYKTKNKGWIGKVNPKNPFDTTNRFMLLREFGLNDSSDPTWNYMLKNIYYIGKIDPDSGSIRIVKEATPRNIETEKGKTYLQILGLDLNGDGILDRYINYGGVSEFQPYQMGYLFIPQPEPFASDLLEEKDVIIYRTTSESAIQNRNVKYLIIAVTKRRPTTINLGLTGIVQNSEEVYFGGERWVRGKDYLIDYDTGIMTILNEEYKIDFSRELKIKFNERALIQTKKRTFINLKGNYYITENSNFTFGIDYRGESTAEQKIRFGEEPKNVLLFNSNLNLEKELPFNLFSFVPWLKTSKDQKLKLITKFNQSFPNPNTRGFAYLDDMESSTLEIFANLNHASWIFGSLPPYLKDTLFNSYLRTPADYHEKNIIFFETNKFLNKDIYPNIPGRQGNTSANVMEVILRPGAKGEKGFASLNQLISSEGVDITPYEYLEVIVKGDKGMIGIDIGTEVVEDACFRDAQGNLIGLGILNSEDGANGGSYNGRFEVVEDVGLDMIPDGEPGDAGNDNYEYRNIEKINGTEGNGRLDTEDIDGNGFNLDIEDCYTYIIDLSTGYYQNNNGFKFYKIPLRDYVVKYGNPDPLRIRKIRIFFTDIPKTDTIYIAKITITGNKYLSEGVFNSGEPVQDPTKKFTITTYSNQQDAHIYKPPPGVVIEVTQEGESEERTLVLRFENFEKGDYGIATRKLYKAQDYWQYRKISFYLKSYPDTLSPKPTFFIKFTTVDTSNYYKYVIKDVPSHWTKYEIDIEKFTQLKVKRGDKHTDKLYTTSGFSGYYVKGHPNFKKIDRFIIGVKNENDKKASGEIWYNELILLSPDSRGAHSIENYVNFDMGEIGNININYKKSSAGFAGLDLQRETFSTEDIGVGTRINLDKIMNISFLKLPFNYSIKSGEQLPIYLTGSDIRLSREQAEREKTKSFSNGFNLSVSRNVASKSQEKKLIDRILYYTIDPFNYNISHQYSRNLTPVNKGYSKNFQQALNYSLMIPFQGIRILGQKINPLPRNIQASLSHSRVKNKNLVLNPIDSIWVQTNAYKREGGNTSYAISGISPLNPLSVDFGGRIDYDLGLRKVTGRFYGKDIKRSSNYSLRYSPTPPLFIKKFIPNLNFNYNSTFNDDHDPINQKDSLNPLRTVNNNVNYTIQGSFNTFEVISGIVRLGNKEAMKDINKFRMLLQNINISFTRNLTSRYFDLTRPPSFLYEIGKTMNPQVDYEENINNSINDSRNLNLSTGTRVFDINVNLSYGERKNFAYTPYQNTRTITRGQNFPNINIQADLLNKKIKFLDPLLSSLSFRTSYNLDRSKNEGTNIISEQRSKSFAPLFSLQGRARNGIGFGITYNKNEQITLSNSGGFITERKVISNGLNLSSDFSISKSVSKKLFGVLRVKSEVNVNLTFSRQGSKTIIRDVEQNNSTTTNLNGTLNFKFTEDITGNFGILYNSNKDNISGYTNKRYEINFGVRINF